MWEPSAQRLLARAVIAIKEEREISDAYRRSFPHICPCLWSSLALSLTLNYLPWVDRIGSELEGLGV